MEFQEKAQLYEPKIFSLESLKQNIPTVFLGSFHGVPFIPSSFRCNTKETYQTGTSLLFLTFLFLELIRWA